MTPVLRQPAGAAACRRPACRGRKRASRSWRSAAAPFRPTRCSRLPLTLPDGSSGAGRGRMPWSKSGAACSTTRMRAGSAPVGIALAGRHAYLQAAIPADAPDTWTASRVRIIGEPQPSGSSCLEMPEIAEAVVANGAIAGAAGQPRAAGRLSALQTMAAAQQLWQYENNAAWVSGDPNAGFVLREPPAPRRPPGTFTWLRNDGTGLQIFAQPYHACRAWPATPMAASGGSKRRRRRLTSGSSGTTTRRHRAISCACRRQALSLAAASSEEPCHRTPVLLAVQPVTARRSFAPSICLSTP